MKTRLCGIDLKSDQKIVELLGSTGNDTSFSQPTFSGVFFFCLLEILCKDLFFNAMKLYNPLNMLVIHVHLNMA